VFLSDAFTYDVLYLECREIHSTHENTRTHAIIEFPPQLHQCNERLHVAIAQLRVVPQGPLDGKFSRKPKSLYLYLVPVFITLRLIPYIGLVVCYVGSCNSVFITVADSKRLPSLLSPS
jgi:hypothetical protein